MQNSVPIDYEVNISIDAQGLFCPEPVMLLHNAVRDSVDGAVICLLATDISTTRDVPKFCSFLKHVLLSQEQQGDVLVYHIRIHKPA